MVSFFFFPKQIRQTPLVMAEYGCVWKWGVYLHKMVNWSYPFYIHLYCHSISIKWGLYIHNMLNFIGTMILNHWICWRIVAGYNSVETFELLMLLKLRYPVARKTWDSTIDFPWPWGYPNSWMAYKEKIRSTGWFGGTTIERWVDGISKINGDLLWDFCGFCHTPYSAF